MRQRGETQFDQPSLGIGEGTSQLWEPAEHVVRGVQRFQRERGAKPVDYSATKTLQYPTRFAYAGHLAHKAASAEPTSPQTLQSYEAMRAQTGAQFAHMTKPESEGGMGMKFEVSHTDPYSTPQEMAADVAQKRIKVLSTETTGGHSFFSNLENDQFRAVHDVMGHAATGRGFSRHGEEAAYQAHAQMYTPEAHAALGAELRHQTSHLIFEGGFPENKPVNLPAWAVAPRPGKKY